MRTIETILFFPGLVLVAIVAVIFLLIFEKEKVNAADLDYIIDFIVKISNQLIAVAAAFAGIFWVLTFKAIFL